MPFVFKKTEIDGLVVIEPGVFHDDRGFFLESYKKSDFESNGIDVDFNQDNHSRSSKWVVRGLHFQREPHAQGKLVRVVRGAIWDVAVDLRQKSPTFKKWFGIELSAENRKMFYIPDGFAHGFVSLEDETELIYKCTNEYNFESDGGVRWNDPDIGISWPVDAPLVSEKDASLPFLCEIGELF